MEIRTEAAQKKNDQNRKNFIVFVILTYSPDIKLFRHNLAILKGKPLVIVDNTEDAKIRREIGESIRGDIDYIWNEKNVGYTKGMNTGMNYAFERGAEWVVLLNDDIQLSDDGIRSLVKQLEKLPPCVAGPFPGYLDPKRWTSILTDKPTKKDPDYISGSFMAVHRDVNKKVQGFYPDFFMYYEDVDYCIQAKKFGFPLVALSLPNIEHKKEERVTQDAEEYYLVRNHLLFVERQAPLKTKLMEIVRLPKALYEYKFFMNNSGFQGVIDFLFLRYGRSRR